MITAAFEHMLRLRERLPRRWLEAMMPGRRSSLWPRAMGLDSDSLESHFAGVETGGRKSHIVEKWQLSSETMTYLSTTATPHENMRGYGYERCDHPSNV